jgi:hypothetical protein
MQHQYGAWPSIRHIPADSLPRSPRAGADRRHSRTLILTFTCQNVYNIYDSRTTSYTKNSVFLGVMPFGSCKNRRSDGTYLLRHEGIKNRRDKMLAFLRTVRQLLVTTYVVPSSRHIPQDGIFQSHRLENIKLYNFLYE